MNAPAVVRRKSGEAGLVGRVDHTLALLAFELESTPSTLPDCRAVTRGASSTKLGGTILGGLQCVRAKFDATGSNRCGVGRGSPPTAPSPIALFDRPRSAARRRSRIGQCRSQGNCTTVPPTRGRNFVAIAPRLPEQWPPDCDWNGPVTVRCWGPVTVRSSSDLVAFWLPRHYHERRGHRGTTTQKSLGRGPQSPLPPDCDCNRPVTVRC